MIDESTKPPRPLKKGAGFTDEDEPEGEVTDMGTLYGKPLGGSTPQKSQSPVIVNQQAVNLTCRKCGKNTGEMAKEEGKSEYMTADKAEARMEEHLLIKHGLPFSPKYYKDTWDPNRAPVRSFRPTKQDKDWMNQLGIKSSKTAADAEGWWRSTQNTERRNVADKLGIGKYWSHFTWDSLPEEIKQKVQMTLPELERNKQIETAWEGPAHVSERDQQIREAWNAPPHTAAGKDWDPVLAKKLYDEGADAAKQGNWDVAHKTLTQSLVHNPYNGPASFLLGIVFAQTGENKAAIHQFEQALRANPKDRYAYHGMVTQMDRDGDLESLEPEVKNYLLDNMISKQAAAKKEAGYSEPDFNGDIEYKINCTGDVVVGDEVRFQKVVFTGNYKNPKFSHFELVTGRVVKDNYGDYKQQHTFTLELPDGSRTLIKGRNLYRNGCWRKPWENEADRQTALDEKHVRGDSARSDRAYRRETDRMLEGDKHSSEKIAVPIEEGNLVCPHCKCDQTKPVEDSEAEGVNLVECMNCGIFFSK